MMTTNHYDLILEFFEDGGLSAEEQLAVKFGFSEQVKVLQPLEKHQQTHVGFATLLKEKGLFEDFIKYLKQHRMKQYGEWIEKHLTDTPDDNRIPAFVNRTNELRTLLSAAEDTKYFMVSAPPGYGKTWLVNEIERQIKLQKPQYGYQGWGVVKVEIDENSTKKDIVTQIGDRLEISDVGEDVNEFAKTYRKFRLAQIDASVPIKGIYWLFNFERIPNKEIYQWLFDTKDGMIFKIYDVEHRLQEKYRIHFRTLVIGRFLNRKDFSRDAPIFSESPDSLSLFTLSTIEGTVQEYLKFESDMVKKFAEHLLNYTAGHPESMCELLKTCKDDGHYDDSFFALTNAKNIWDEYVKRYAQKIYDELRNLDRKSSKNYSIESVFERLAIFPIIPKEAMKSLANQYGTTLKILREELQDTFILRVEVANGIELADSIYRGLILLYLEYEKPDILLGYIDWGEELLEQLIKTSEYPARHAINWLELQFRRYKINLTYQPTQTLLKPDVFAQRLRSLYQQRYIDDLQADLEMALDELKTALSHEAHNDFKIFAEYILGLIETSQTYEQFVESVIRWEA